MSAFMVEDKSINKIVSWLAEDRDIQSWLEYFHPEIQLNGKESSAKLGQALFDMNVDSINQRYGDNQAQEFRPLDYAWRSEIPDPDIRTYKTLSCLLYQCCEGNVDETPLYKSMQAISDHLAHRIVGNLKAYDDAPWE